MDGKKEQSELRRAENEVVFKEHNQRTLKHAAGLLDDASKADLPIGFVCECSNEDCKARLEMPIVEFRNLRENHKQFIILPGHERPDIERAVRKMDGWQVVEKYNDPPPTNGVLNKT